MANKSGPRALLIQLEFPNWHRARSWAFSANYGIRDALLAHGIECVTIPALADSPSSTPDSFVWCTGGLIMLIAFPGERPMNFWVHSRDRLLEGIRAE